MSSDRHAQVATSPHGRLHHARVTRVRAASDVGRGDQPENFLIRTDRVGPKALAEVRIEVYCRKFSHCARTPSVPTDYSLIQLPYCVLNGDLIEDGAQ